MQYSVPRLLGLCVALWVLPGVVWGGAGITAVQEIDAIARCDSECAIWQAWAPGGWTSSCKHGSASGGSAVRAEYQPPASCNRIGQWYCNRYYNGVSQGIHSSSEPGFNAVAYCVAAPDCELALDEAQAQHWVSDTLPNPISPPSSICVGACSFYRDPSQGCSEECVYTDTNGSGSPDAGDSYSCPCGYSSWGEACDASEEDQVGNPAPGALPCANVSCSGDEVPGDPGDTGTGGNLPGDDVNPGGSSSGAPPGGASGGADGDPDTPGGPGQGTGDTDGDGDRDVDCNPLSNPDCMYTGDGQGSGDCDSQPVCSGDPVQCAQLYQQWAIMCYDGDSFSNPGNCAPGFECEGDKLLCEIIRQRRQQYCDLFQGSGGHDLDVFNDSDFDDDLKEDADIIDLPSSFDTTGWYGGGACPSPFPFEVFGNSYTISVQGWCDLAPTIRVFVILAAILSGLYILMGRVD